MGLRRLLVLLAASGAAVLATLVATPPVAAFDGFGQATAESTYGDEMRFTVQLDGAAPQALELLLSTPEAEGDFVARVSPSGSTATYVWDTSAAYVTPNTPVTYRWRAVDGDRVVESSAATHVYDDDRPGFDWQTAGFGQATVHWYGDAEGRARRFGELTATGAERAAELLGAPLAEPVDIFVYDSQDDFRGALGPGAREWVGAAAYPELRTIFMWLGGGSDAYLEVAILHEVTHVVFFDATDNPYHEPARWLNEGIATWSESGDAGDERSVVEFEAGAGTLLAFPAITAQFPIQEGAARLAYAQGTVMVDHIVDRFGQETLAAIAQAYRDGATDDEALEAGTGIPAPELYADFFATFGVDPPQRVEAEPIPPSNVDRPPASSAGGGPRATPPADPAPIDEPDDEAATDALPVLLLLLGGAGAALVAAVAVHRRAARGPSGP